MTKPATPAAPRGPSLVERLSEFWEKNPGAVLTTREGVRLFGGSPHSFRQAMYELRRRGTPIRADRVFRLRNQPVEPDRQ